MRLMSVFYFLFTFTVCAHNVVKAAAIVIAIDDVIWGGFWVILLFLHIIHSSILFHGAARRDIRRTKIMKYITNGMNNVMEL